jgi:sugar phosphate isomerase/epimerase
MNISRRNLLSGIAAAPLLGVLTHAIMDGSDIDKEQQLACNSWPFRGYFDTPQMHQYRNPQYPLLTQAEFPEFVADHFRIHNIEFLPQHFADTELSTIEKVKAGLKKANSRCCNLMGIDLPGNIFSRDIDRQAMLNEAQRWVAVAVALGSPSITIALSGKGPVNAQTAAYNLTPAVGAAHRHGIKVLFHNDDIQRESAETLTSLVKQLGPDRTGTCPDFGNFATKSASYALSQLRMLAPYASNICHSKDGIAEKGTFYADDFPASMKVMRDTGFHGLYSLEFEGLGDPLDGIHKLMNLTEKYLG